jgi:hypothetical protein
MPNGTRTLRATLTVGALLALAATPAFAQGTGGPVISDSKVGYIDDAVPANLFRFRFDSAYDSNRSTRAEFFYPRTQPFGPGLPKPEPHVDYQDLSAYGEYVVFPRLSVFAEVPVRFLNPEVNDNAWGLADIHAGFKYAFLMDETNVVSFQLRTDAPTGDSHRGLGNHHVSLEPGFLFLRKLDERTRVEGELRYWIPIDGTSFAGDILRYGIGFSRDVYESDCMRVTPVVELVGWTVLSGKESVVPAFGPPTIQNAAGDTIVNLKLGLRWTFGERLDFYTGWGVALTGERWYEDIFRFEARLHF